MNYAAKLRGYIIFKPSQLGKIDLSKEIRYITKEKAVITTGHLKRNQLTNIIKGKSHL